MKNGGARDLTVTYCKAIAMIMVVIGHSGVYSLFVDWIYFFHVPVFFFLSGYCFKDKYLLDSWGFVKRRFGALWKPFALTTLSFILIHNTLLIIYDLPISKLREFPVLDMGETNFWWIVYSCMGIAIPLLVSYSKNEINKNINIMYHNS